MSGPSDLVANTVLIGTGLAPLVAAKTLQEQQKSVVVLNPDWNFFQEDSELPFDPSPENSKVLSSNGLLELVRPPFPGAVEWSPLSDPSRSPAQGFRVVSAPHMMTRTRIRIQSPLETDFEERFLRLEEQGYRPLEYRDQAALRRFPGYATPQTGAYSSETRGVRGLWVPHQWDIDVRRYRVGVHEFLLDRLGSERLLTGLSDIEPVAESIRFRDGNNIRQISNCENVIVFWTPSLTKWLARLGVKDVPSVDVWERWTLVSRDKLAGELSGEFENLWVMPELEGEEESSSRLAVYRRDPSGSLAGAVNEASLDALSRLCLGLMGWDKFSIRSYRAHERFREPIRAVSIPGHKRWSVILGADGSLIQVLKAAQAGVLGIQKGPV